MKKFLISCSVLFTVLSAQAKVGDDLTAKYLKNADFSADSPVTGRICTYDYDMAGGTHSMFGQQSVTGWTALNLSDNVQIMENSGSTAREDGANARAGGIFGVGLFDADDNRVGELGGMYYAPEVNSNDQEEGNVLGLIAVWGATIQYTQQVTLPAGCYTITVPTYNSAGSGAVTNNLFGFIADNGKAYTCTDLTWAESSWTEQSITFILSEETSGVISLGFTGPGGSGSMPHLFIDYIQITEGDPEPIIQAEVDALKEQLLPLLEDGDELGVDTRAGWSVYNNANATAEEVKNAIATQKENNEKGMTDFTDYFLKNAHFTDGTPQDNGICTYAKDQEVNGTTYFGMQPVDSWTPTRPGVDGGAAGLFAVGSGQWCGSKEFIVPTTKADGSTEGNVFGFVACWTFSASYTQQVTLPAGNYTITIPTFNSAGTTAIAENLCGFIADNGDKYLAETTVFPVGKWASEVVKFTLDEETSGVISIGYTSANVGSANMPHLWVDEFTLKYNGVIEESPSLIALRGAVRTAEEYDEIYEAKIKAELEEAINAGSDLVRSNSKDDDANVEAATKINNLLIAAKASAATYDKFINFIDGQLADAIVRYSEGDLSEFADELSDDLDAYKDAYENGDYSTAQINEIINGFQAKIAEAVSTVLTSAAADGAEHNIDISVLFQNIDYANSTIEGWQNETGTGAFLSRVQTAEVWNQSNFNVYQTLADMPAGVYQISAPGFYRTAANDENYMQWSEKMVSGRGYIYANGNKVLMHNVAEYAAAEDENHTALVDGDLYVPNSNNNANYVFYTQKEAVNTVNTALIEAGDLTIGVKGEELSGNAWVVWGGFSVVYKGVSEDLTLAAMDDQIQGLIEQAMMLSEDGIIASVEKASEVLNQALLAGEEAIEAHSIDTKSTAIATLKEAIAYAQQTTPLVEKLMETVGTYVTLVGDAEFSSDDATLSDLLDEIGDPEDGAPSNEKIQEWMDKLPIAWTQFVLGQPEVASASLNAPADVSPAILNASFEGVNSETAHTEYWAVTKDGGNEGYEFGIYEFFNNNSFDINQTIQGLTPGFYRVKVQAFYRAGSNAANLEMLTQEPDSINHAQLYANGCTVNLKNVLDLENVDESGYEAGSAFGMDGEIIVNYKDNAEFTIPNNRNSLSAYFEAGCYWNEVDCEVGQDGKLSLGLSKAAHVADDWCPYDNFQLFYLGTTAPTAIDSVAGKTISTAIYDLQGRKVAAPAKGLYIKGGKTYLVK